jgi:hypothetical protein
MREIIQQYAIPIFTGILTIFVSMVGWVIKEYYASQKKTDEEVIKMINGLGERLNKSINDIKKDIHDFRLELKLDNKELEKKIDSSLDILHEVEKRIIVNGYEEELKRLKSLKQK